MSLVRWNPQRSISNLQKEIDDIFGSYGFSGSTKKTEENELCDWCPNVDIKDSKNAYLFKVELPGVSKEDVNVNLSNDVLTIQGEKKSDQQKEEENQYAREIFYGTFFRSFKLPSSVDSDNIKANFKDGILSLELPKNESAQSKKIEIK